MNLLDSLLDAIVRLDGDALVMHVGEKPYVVTTSATMNEYRGPLAWGQVELSTRVLTTDAVLGMLGQILSLEQRQALEEYGAIEHEIAAASGWAHRFTVVAARGGDDVWLEVRRRSLVAAVAAVEAAVNEAPAEAVAQESYADTAGDAVSEIPAEDTEAPALEVVQDEAQQAPTDADADATLAAPGATATGIAEAAVPAAERIEPEPVAEPAVAIQQESEPVAPPLVAVESDPVPVREPGAVLEPDTAPVSERAAAAEPEPEPVAQRAEAPDVAIEREPEPLVEPAPLRAAGLVREPEPVVERIPTMPAAIEAEAEPVRHTVPAAAVEIEPEPEPVVERIAAPADTLEAEAPPVHEPRIEPGIRVLEPEPVAVSSVARQPEIVGSEEEPVAEQTAAVELESPPVREAVVAVPRIVIEPDPEPVRDIVAFRPEPRPIADATPSIEPVPEPIVVADGAQSAAIALDPEPMQVQQTPVTIEGESIVQRAPAIEPDMAPVAEPPPVVASEPEPVADARANVQPETPIQEPAPVEAQEPVMAAAEPMAREPMAASAPELAATRPPALQTEAAPAAAAAPKADDGHDQRSAIVLPLSRYAIKPDQPAAETRPAAALPLDRVLRIAAARGAATVYVIAQSAPMIRVDGEISALDGETPWTSADIDRLVMDLAPARVRDGGQASGEWVTDVPDVGRVRCVTFRDHRGPGVIFRMIPPRAISAEQLGLSAEIQALCSQSDGLVLVTGARASGKSTLLSAFVDVINRTRSDHVITIEPQIGFVHESRRSFVSQREVRGDSEQTASAVRSAFREDPDVLMIEDLRTHEIVALALEAAESGRLVFGSIPAPSAVAAIDRLIELFPAERRAQAQTSLAGSLRGVISQVLLRKARGGRVAAREVLLNTPAVAGLIMEGKTFQLPVALDSGRRQGMTPLADSLAALVRDGTVQVAEAYRKAQDREALLTILRREGVDTSFVERLA